jgi:DNA-binding CsgD family transcriptional regulator
VAGAKLSHGLTRREAEVLKQLTKGSTNKEIARALGISERTAGVHVSHLLRKLRCTTRTQAVSYAISQGLVQFMFLLAIMGGMLRGRPPAPTDPPRSAFGHLPPTAVSPAITSEQTTEQSALEQAETLVQ